MAEQVLRARPARGPVRLVRTVRAVRVPRVPRVPGVRDVLRAAVLLVAGVCALGLAGTAAALLTGGSVLVIRSGSMAPGIPVGTALVVRPAPARSARPGDVLGVREPGGRIVVHRLVSNVAGTGAATPAIRSLVLRGDANPSADSPVIADTVLRPVVVVRSPWPGRVAAGLQARWAQFWLGIATGMLTMVGWYGLDPRRSGSRARRAARP